MSNADRTSPSVVPHPGKWRTVQLRSGTMYEWHPGLRSARADALTVAPDAAGCLQLDFTGPDDDDQAEAAE